jgi:diguanylate cyclase (GGDEF)-like protein
LKRTTLLPMTRHMEGGGSAPPDGQVACSTSSVLLRRLRATGGDAAVGEVLRRAGVGHTPAYLEDLANWISYRDSIALFEAAAAVTGDDRIAQRVGEETVRQHAGTPVATLLRSLGSPQAVYEQLSLAVAKFSTVSALEPESVGAGEATVVARARDGFRRDRNMCLLMLGMLSQPTVLFGLPPARVDHPECELRGDARCRYVVTWDAGQAAIAADPEQLVVALETQLQAMGDRLENMYATARDLIAIDDLDAALQRITERAATAVRAPRYLLAVRTGPDRDPHVHHHGLAGDDVDAEARELLDRERVAAWTSTRLVADVASRTRHYGRLMAASPAGAFFPHERDLLEVYARYAAAVLDSHAAIAAAREREAQSRALLSLAQALAAATTSDEVSARLAATVPAVVDCDRVSVMLWDETEEALVVEAARDLASPGPAEARVDRVRPADTPQLGRLIEQADPEPLFFGADTEDPFVRGAMAQGNARAAVVVPIVAHGRFYGILNVTATDRPERLRPTPALRDRLAGVVAQAATALDSARLLEQMAHQARHDSLTGLLGHRAFHEALGTLLDASAGAQFTLASIDLDDFKAINDAHGHPVGDEALRLVSDALRRVVRDADAVFRVGGEEFAVLLPGLAALDAAPVAERLRAAVAEAPFPVPVRVSVGLASWPAEAADAAALLERADAALYAAKRGGKDRVALAPA